MELMKVGQDMKDSQELLAEYVKTGSEAAFAEVANRYLNFVYSVALRLVGGDTVLAEDVAQTVFINLARKAPGLSSQVSLGGWLHEHTFHVATKAARAERRRQARERKAMEASMLQDDSGVNLATVGPILDEAIRQLSTEDRTAVLLRFFEQRDFRAVGEALGSSEDAARMRVNRAVEKLHGFLRQRGVPLSAAALATGLATEVITAAPAGLATTIAGTALAGAATGGTAVTALKIMSMTKVKFALMGTVVAALAAPLLVQQQTVSRLREENQSLQQQQAQTTQLAAENERLSNQLAQANSTQTQGQLQELLKLRGEVGMLRRQSKELARLQEENRQLRARPLTVQQSASDRTEGTLSPEDAARNTCINHLRQIDGAIQQCALEHSLSSTNVVTAEQIMPYLRDREEVFKCPSGGTYSFGVVSNAPTCSIPGHAIPTGPAQSGL
jgi:RNA polymerase sigma factor (sigma-70 family)